MLVQEPSIALPGEAAIVRLTSAARRGARLLLAALLSAGCTTVSDVTGMATYQDLLEVRAEVAKVQQGVQRMKAEADAARAQAQAARTQAEAARTQNEQRDRERTSGESRQLETLSQRLDGLTSALNTLTGRVDELAARTEALGAQTETLGRELRSSTPAPSPQTAAVSPPPPAAPAAPAPVAPQASAPPVAPAPPAEASPGFRPSTNALRPEDIYQAAYIDFSKGSYPLAIAGFREFLRRFPDHPLGGAAQYWVGEAHFAVARGYTNAGQADKAAEAFRASRPHGMI